MVSSPFMKDAVGGSWPLNRTSFFGDDAQSYTLKSKRILCDQTADDCLITFLHMSHTE